VVKFITMTRLFNLTALAAVFVLAFLVVVPCGGAEPGRWQRMSAEEFWKLPAVNKRIDFSGFDQELMAGAIFHATNRVRLQLALRPFRHLIKLDAAADIQAGAGVLMGELSHHSLLPFGATPSDRIQSVGLHPKILAENLALTTALDNDPKVTTMGVRKPAPNPQFYDLATGRDLRPPTYAQFAATVVQQWMDSPGHRANIVNPQLDSLGCSARWRLSSNGVEVIYSVQVFCTL
jgi:uncharacterized protein YkwD